MGDDSQKAGVPVLLDPAGHRFPGADAAPRPPAVRSDAAAALVGILSAMYFWKAQPVSLTASIVAAGVSVCAVMWLVMDFAPWLRSIAAARRLAVTCLSGVAFAGASLMLLAHGDLGEPKPEFTGVIDSVASFTAKKPPGPPYAYWLEVKIENNGGPSYTNEWLPFFVNSGGKRIYGNVIPPPPHGSPVNIQVQTRAGPMNVPWSFENVIYLKTFPSAVGHDDAATGVLVAEFLGPEQPTAPTDVNLRFVDRVGKEYVLKFTPIGPSL